MTCTSVLVLGVQQMNQLHIHVCPLCLRFFSQVRHCRVLSRPPCSVQQVLTSYQLICSSAYMRLHKGLRGYRIRLQCRRYGFDPWVGKIPWRRAWQPTPVFFPGEPHGQRSLVGYSPWGYKESDMTERLSRHPVYKCQSRSPTLSPHLTLWEL